MSRRPIARNITKKERIKREKDPIPWRYCLTTLACGLFLVAGFFGAARQHFASMDLGFKNSELRKQLTKLEDENRRLLLSKEIALSPGEIKKSAQKIGMVELSASNIEIFSTREDKAIQTAKTAKPLVEKTVDLKPVKDNAKESVKETVKETIKEDVKQKTSVKTAQKENENSGRFSKNGKSLKK